MGRPAARNLALVAGAVIVVSGFAVWWISRLRSIEQESRREPGSSPDDLRNLRTQIRDLENALTRIAREKGIKTDPVPEDRPEDRPKEAAEEASATHLRALVRAYEAATDTKDRDRILDGLTYAHSMYAETTGDLQFLPFLRGVIEGSPSADQRKNAVIALHGVGRREVVDLLEELLADANPEVRFYAAEALPWVAGAERDRARGLLAGTLDHEDPEVRRIAALSLGVVMADPVHVDPMLRRLAVETTDSVLEALVFAVRRLLPNDGEARIRALLPTLDRTRADRIESLLR